jgi:type I restriction enzyme S subunit
MITNSLAKEKSELVRSEIGVFPSDWPVRRLDQITGRISVGLVINPSTYISDQGTVPMLLGSQVMANKIDHEAARRITPQSNAKIPASILRAGDLVTVRVGDPGTTAVIDDELDGCNCASMMIVRRSTSYNSAWLSYLMNSPLGRRQVANVQYGTAQKQFNIGDAVGFLFPVPSKTEQDAIANALTAADALIDSLEQLLTKKRQIKQGVMQELLTGERRLPEFEAAWTDGVLGDVVAELVAGVSVNSDPTVGGEGVPSVVKTSALKGGVFDPSECKPIVHAELARATTPLRHDTLLISRMNTPDLVGEVGYVDRAYDWLYLPDRVWMTRMRSPDCVCVRWLGYLLSSAPYKRLIGDTATGTSGSMKNIAKSGLLRLPLRFPEVDEQRAIAAGLADMDAEITALESRLSKSRALKQAMAQDLLTGRIRLIESTE